jgi:polysaccharide deacetylase family protein (PEP-CTERM system associated)
MVKNILSIDVEEIFHIEYAKNDNKNYSYRSLQNISLVLNLLSKYNTTATFFLVGEVAQVFPEIINMIKEEGHEVALHGWSHFPLWRLDTTSFEKEVRKFKQVHSGCRGFRAPSFSLKNETKWALDVIEKYGFKYDSSIFPTWTPLYGVPKAPIEPYYPSRNDISEKGSPEYEILEFPMTVYSLAGIKIPIAGGFWLRFWNISLIDRCIKKLNEGGLPAVLYFHNWEFDPGIPKLDLNFIHHFVTYYNLSGIEKKIRHLLRTFKLTSFTDYIDEV